MHHLHTVLFVLVLFWKMRVSRMHILTCKETGNFVAVEKEQGKLFSSSQSERQMAELVPSGYWDRACSVFIRAVAKTMYLSVALTRNTKSPRLSWWPHMLPHYRNSYVRTSMPTANPERVWRIRPKVFVGNQTSDACIHKVFVRRLFMQKLKVT